MIIKTRNCKILKKKKKKESLDYLISSFKNGKEFGSILTIKPIDFEKIDNLILNFESSNNLTKFKYLDEINRLKDIINQSKLLSKKYDVVVTNPPYMGNNGMNPNLKEYIKSNYPLTKTDLFAVFLEKGLEMIKDYGFNCMVTMQSWMFLSSFEKFRKKLIETTTISNLLHMDNMVMRIAFGTSATIFRKINLMNYNSTFYHVKLSDVENDVVDPLFFNDKNKFIINSSKFKILDGSQIAYWFNENMFHNYITGTPLGKIASPRKGNSTSNNKKFLRYWFEVDYNDINFNATELIREETLKRRWYPYNKGGGYRKWYGNNYYLIDWYDDAKEIRSIKTAVIANYNYFMKPGLTWSTVTSSNFSIRKFGNGFIFDNGGCCIFDLGNDENYILGLLNSCVFKFMFGQLNPTLNFQSGEVAKFPIIFTDDLSRIDNLVKLNIKIEKENWDVFETSWDFKTNIFINMKFNKDTNKLEDIYNNFSIYQDEKFNQLKTSEETLNKEFLRIYNLTNEISYEVDEEYVTFDKLNLKESIELFISFAVGCMFGRYSLDNEGLQFAGGEFNINNYNKFKPDDDNIIPVLDTAYFDDDIVGYFTKFVETCFGKETLEENLDFIAGALSNSNKPSREIIRDYFLKNFFNDHKKTYKKCPIYWQFSSGKHNGFNCLVYMHRYEPSLVARIRTYYLHKTQKAIEQRIANTDNIINNSTSKQEVANATKEKTKLQKQLKETQEYDEVLAHIANKNIEINLDDGVTINYSKFQDVEVSKEGEKTKKLNLLKKI